MAVSKVTNYAILPPKKSFLDLFLMQSNQNCTYIDLRSSAKKYPGKDVTLTNYDPKTNNIYFMSSTQKLNMKKIVDNGGYDKILFSLKPYEHIEEKRDKKGNITSFSLYRSGPFQGRGKLIKTIECTGIEEILGPYN